MFSYSVHEYHILWIKFIRKITSALFSEQTFYTKSLKVEKKREKNVDNWPVHFYLAGLNASSRLLSFVWWGMGWWYLWGHKHIYKLSQPEMWKSSLKTFFKHIYKLSQTEMWIKLFKDILQAHAFLLFYKFHSYINLYKCVVILPVPQLHYPVSPIIFKFDVIKSSSSVAFLTDMGNHVSPQYLWYFSFFQTPF